MSNDQGETGCNTEVAVTADKMLKRNANHVPAPEGTPTVRPWTEDFLLPSISFREPERS